MRAEAGLNYIELIISNERELLSLLDRGLREGYDSENKHGTLPEGWRSLTA